MRCLIRKIFLILAIVSFLAVVTGLISALHLSSHKNHQGHGSDHCSICQQLLTMPKGFSLQPEPKIGDTDQFERYTVPHYVTFIKQPYLKPFNPRPPPEAS